MESRPASSIPLAQLVRLVNSAFEGYVGGVVNHDEESLAAWCRKHFMVLELSHVFFDTGATDGGADNNGNNDGNGGEPIAFGLIAVREDRPGQSRLAAFGVTGWAQGKGIGSRAMVMIAERERERGVEVLELECMQHNPRGVKMYQKLGFEVLRDLPGWVVPLSEENEVQKQGDDAAALLEEVTVEEVDALVKRWATADLPWQAWFVSTMAMAKRGFRLGHAWCVTSDPEGEAESKGEKTVELATLIVEPGWRRRGEGTRLIRAMMGRFRGRKWEVPAILPAEYVNELARRFGAERGEKAQYQMRLKLQ
jgi:ribosomal protein S18 acetylase RimI-like enzyme